MAAPGEPYFPASAHGEPWPIDDPPDGLWEACDKGQDVYLRAQGRSMRPLYPSGTLFLIKPLRPDDLRLGDLILIRTHDGAVLHRLLRHDRKRRRLVTKGDMRPFCDPPWPYDALKGRVEALWRGRNKRLWRQSAEGRLAPLFALLGCALPPLAGLWRKGRPSAALLLLVALACACSETPAAYLPPTWIAVPTRTNRELCTTIKNGDKQDLCCYAQSRAPFHITATEITAAQAHAALHGTAKGSANTPATGYTYDEAQAVCHALGGRLPTDEEWTLAWRWDEEAPAPDGDGEEAENEGESAHKAAKDETACYGLDKISPSLAEWLSDCLHTQCQKRPNDPAKVWNGDDCTQNLLRLSAADPANYAVKTPATRSAAIGFRCVREASGPKAGKVLPEFVPIEGGRFAMGCAPDELDCGPEAQPKHQVQVASFALTRYEITEQQYLAAMGSFPKGGLYGCSSCPMTGLNALEAQGYCQAIGARLPSEAEWEYAARAHLGGTYLCNDPSLLYGFAVTAETAEGNLAVVGAKAPNGFGLFDMLGNAREWTADSWHDSYAQAPADSRPWIDPDAKGQVVRGASFNDPRSPFASFSARIFAAPLLRQGALGFRCARP